MKYLSILPLVASLAQAAEPLSSRSAIVERGSHHRVWEEQSQEDSEPAFYVELAAGLHYWRVGQWNEARAEIEIAPNGAAATRGQHQVHFAPNINSPGDRK